jgi:MoxR-like ATPase
MTDKELFQNLIDSASVIIQGKEEVLKLAFLSFFSGGHLLIEDLPGVGKTTLSKTLAKLLNLEFKRIQVTNDLLPSDILGYKIYSKENEAFQLEKGPIFTEVLLTDELNRASPKTQSALLEAMEEKVISLEGERFDLSKDFFVIATQNPFGQIGTFPLPESQLDRFCMKISIGTPSKDIEVELLMNANPVNKINQLESVVNEEKIKEIKENIEKIHISKTLSEYVVNLLNETRQNDIFQPLSPRAGIDMITLIKTKAFFEGRDFANSDDVINLAKYVFGHRIHPAVQATVEEGTKLTSTLLEKVKAP